MSEFLTDLLNVRQVFNDEALLVKQDSKSSRGVGAPYTLLDLNYECRVDLGVVGSILCHLL